MLGRNTAFRTVSFIGILVFVLSLLTACSGGGGGGTGGSSSGSTKTVSGVAAAGAPIIGNVYLKDSSSIPKEIGPNPIDSNGNFSFEVTGLNPPFYLYADGMVAGHSYKLFSATTGAGTANINPLANLAVASAVGVNNPATAYNNPVGYPITSANLSNAIADIQNLLQPILSAYGANVNPITGSAAVGSALDTVFDVVAVSIDTGTGGVTVTDKTTGSTIGSTTTTTISSATQVTQVPSQQALADLQAIGTTLSQFAAAINKVGHTASDFDPLVAANFGIYDGFDRTQYINDWAGISFTSQITSVKGLTIISKDTNTGDYYVDGIIMLADGRMAILSETGLGMHFTNEGGTWKIAGNGYKMQIQTFQGMTTTWIKADNSTQTESGLWVELADRGNWGLKTAIVTGPGLPQTGITISAQSTTPVVFKMDPLYQSSAIPTCNTVLYVMDDATIGAIPDNATYTLAVYNNSNALVETRPVRIGKRPYLRSEVTYPAYFPTITPPASHNLADENIGGTFNYTYARPSSTTIAHVILEAHIEFWDNTGNYANYEDGLSLDTGTSSIISGTPAWTPVQGDFYFFAWGQGRATQYVWMFQ